MKRLQPRCKMQKEDLRLNCNLKHLFQFDALKQYIEKGGNLLILLGEGGETRFDTNINFLLEDYGIMVNNGMRNNSALPLMHTRRM